MKKQQQQILEPLQYFYMAFTKTFSTLSNQNIKQGQGSLFQFINIFVKNGLRQYLSSKQNHTDLARDELRRNLQAHGKTICVEWLFGYGCAVVMQQKDPGNYPSIYVVFNSSWDVDTFAFADQTIMFPIPLSQYKVLYVGKMNDVGNISTLKSKFIENLNSVIIQSRKNATDQPNKVKNHHTPSWIAQACHKAIENFFNSKSNETEKKPENKQVLSKGGCLDVSYHVGTTKPDTVWCVTWAVIAFYAGDPQFVKALQFAYRASLLKKYCQQVTKDEEFFSKQQKRKTKLNRKSCIAGFMSCMRELRSEMEELNVCNLYYSNKKSISHLKEIAKNITAINLQSISLTKTLEEMGKRTDFKSFNLDIKSLIPKCQEKFKQIPENMICLTSSFKVESDFSIQEFAEKYNESFLWVMAFEDTIFTLAFNELNKIIPFEHFNRSIYSDWNIDDEINSSSSTLNSTIKMFGSVVGEVLQTTKSIKIFELLEYYHKVIFKDLAFSMNSKSQAHSHFQLVKAIFSVMTFEIFQRQNKETIYNVEGYRVPIDILNLYNHFNSMSFKARLAMEAMQQYFDQNKQKVGIFCQKNPKVYREYALPIASRIESLIQKVKTKQQNLKLRQTQLKDKIRQYHIKLDFLKEQLRILQNAHCGCYYIQETGIDFLGRETRRSRKIECSRCSSISLKINQIFYHEQLQEQKITTILPLNERLVHEFYSNVNSELGGLINVLLMGQHSFQSYQQEKVENKGQNLCSLLKLYIVCSKAQSQKFRLLYKRESDTPDLINYAGAKIDIMFNSFIDPTISYLDMDSDSHDLKLGQLESMFIQNPTVPPDQFREHQIYANLINRPNSMRMQQFIVMGSCRVSEHTQLPVLLQGLAGRYIQIDTTSNECRFRQQLINRCLTKISALMPKYNNGSSCVNDTIWRGMEYYMKTFVEDYMKKWISKDILGLPVIGPVISLITKTLIHTQLQPKQYSFIFNNEKIEDQTLRAGQIFRQIVSKANIEYQRIEEDLHNSKESAKQLNSNRENQCFIYFGAICLFTEQILDPMNQLAVDFVTYIVGIRHNQIYLGSNVFEDSFRKTILMFHEIKFRAIESNIQQALQYFKLNPNKLTIVVKTIDEGIDLSTNWLKCPINQGQFLFSGRSNNGDAYQIDIKCGKMTKNGQLISRIPQSVKQTSEYQQIFEKRDFEVYPSFLGNTKVTKKDFRQIFIGNIGNKDSVVFEFGQRASSAQSPVINMVVKFQEIDQNETWSLLPIKSLTNLIHLPLFYSEGFYAWYSEIRSCIVLRKINLVDMGKIALVIFVNKNQNGQTIVDKIHVISTQHQNSHFNFVCNRNETMFDKLILRDRQPIMPYQIFQKIEEQKFILELQSYETQKRKFWFHRFGLIFNLHDEHGLVPQNFKNYRVFHSPHTHPYLPWNQKDKVSCLVLQKYVHNQTTQQLHKIKVLLPKQLVNEQTQINVSIRTYEQRSVFVYDVHDHFNDIRGNNRLSQLHMVGVLASLNNNLRHFELKITPIEYALRILYSCFNNEPLSKDEARQIQNIFGIASCQRNESLILMCSALIDCTKQIQELHSYDKRFKTDLQIFQDQNYRQVVEKCKSKYIWKMSEGRLPVRQMIPFDKCQILGLKNYQYNKYWKGKYWAWRQKNKFSSIFPEASIEKFLKQQQSLLRQWRNLNEEAQKNDDEDSVDEINNQLQLMEDFPLDIKDHQKSNSLKELKEELSESYKIYKKKKVLYDSIKVNKQQLLPKFQEIREKMISKRDEIIQILNGFILLNKEHPDILSGFLPVLSKLDFVKILLEEYMQNKANHMKMIDLLYPQVCKETKSKIVELIKNWILFVVKLDSCQRVLNILSHVSLIRSDTNNNIDIEADKVALFREFESPRNKIQGKIYWVCFEAEMKIQIWSSQYQTYDSLFKNSSGSVTQLNMGEGKTQTIIPMIALQLLFGRNLSNNKILSSIEGSKHKIHKIPRVNLMQALMNQSKHNYFKFLSVTSFNIPIVILPFNRKVNFSNYSCRNAVIRSLGYFKERMLILLDQSSTHSLILKLREEALRDKQVQFDKEKAVFRDLDLFDIFDQVDAQLTPKKTFVYSIGNFSGLTEYAHRISVPCQIIQALCIAMDVFYQRGIISFDQTYELAHHSLNRGEFPRGYRIISSAIQERTRKLDFRRFLVKILAKSASCDLRSVLETLNESERENVVEYLINDHETEKSLPNLMDEAKSMLYVFRGYLAYGVLQHCLFMRCKVNYGIPSPQRKLVKKLSVPYEAADIPSKRNDFAHPEVAIILTYLSYFNFGLTEEELFECFDTFFKITDQNFEVRSSVFRSWVISLSDEQRKKLKIQTSDEIKLHSVSQKKRLFESFRMNRKFISYWLQNCVFEKDMAQFVQSITSSSWDHANVKTSIGFSGTKDNCKLLPTYMNLISPGNEQIKGTDGKMLDMMIRHVREVKNIELGQKPMWERFINTILNLPSEYKVGCIIDAGAILASKPLKQFIVPHICKQQNFNTQQLFKGVSYCSNNEWKVHRFSTNQEIQRGTSISDSETFVIFDEYRTRGADLKMDSNITAVLTLSPTITKDSLMQAVGRLRKIGRNQKVVIIMTDEIQKKINIDYKYRQQMSTEEKVKIILSWSCLNSVNENERFLYPNAKTANIHFKNIHNKSKKPFKDIADTKVKTMYSPQIKYKSIFNLCQKALNFMEALQTSEGEKQLIKKLKSTSRKYGENKLVKAQNFQEVCERQSQLQKQEHQQRQVETYKLKALKQTEGIKKHSLSKKSPFKFSQSLMISQNFHNCTQVSYVSENYNSQNPEMNELMCSLFLRITEKQIVMITQRQVQNLLISSKVPFYTNVQSIDRNSVFIVRMSDLKIESPIIKSNKLEEAFVQCKFFNGETEFEHHEQSLILKNLLASEQNKKQKLQFFLQRRRRMNKFKSSTLQKVYKELCLLPEKFERLERMGGEDLVQDNGYFSQNFDHTNISIENETHINELYSVMSDNENESEDEDESESRSESESSSSSKIRLSSSSSSQSAQQQQN